MTKGNILAFFRTISFASIALCTVDCSNKSKRKPITFPPVGANEGPSSDKPGPPEAQKSAELTEWQYHGWIAKAARVLHAGNDSGLKVEELAQKSREEVADILVNHPAFGDSAFDFFMYFQGFKPRVLRNTVTGFQIRDPEPLGRGQTNLFSMPNAVAAARATVSQSNVFEAFFTDLYPWFATPIIPVQNKKPEEMSLSDPQIRAQRFNALLKKIETLKQLFDGGRPLDNNKFCKEYAKDHYFDPGNDFYDMGFGRFSAAIYDNYKFGKKRDFLCFDGASPEEKAENQVTLEDVNEMERWSIAFFQELQKFEVAAYPLRSIVDVKSVNVSQLLTQEGQTRNHFSVNFTLWLNLSNSSTSRNRKRAAFVLKNFFCDDLTPINVVIPQAHTTTKVHGAQPACYSCHYKLDPMAGFFKNLGGFGEDYTGQKEIAFDDNVVANLEEYQKEWQNPPGTNPAWNIGFVRSATNASLNTYGENVSDLLKILSTAPEVKKCVVKKMFQYYVSPVQNVDPAYLDSLSEVFTKAPNNESGKGFKEIAKKLILSEAFLQDNPKEDTCYDSPNLQKKENATSCLVNKVLADNCTSCHNSGSPGGGLNLEKWIKSASGEENFEHIKGGSQVSKAETFKSMIERIQSDDPKTRMPLLREMDTLARQNLFLWLNQKKGGDK